MRFTTEWIDKKKALALLLGNRMNRPLRDTLVLKYAHSMSQGKWLLCPDPVIFDKDGRCLNGQHRLWAVVHSDTRQLFIVCRDCDENLFGIIDGGAGRKFADRLVIDRMVKGMRSYRFNPKCYISAVRLFVHAPDTKNLSWNVDWTIDAFEEIERKVAKHVNFAMELLDCGSDERKFRKSPIVTAIARADYAGVDRTKIMEYVKTLVHAGSSMLSDAVGNKFVLKTRDWLKEHAGIGGRGGVSETYLAVARSIDCFSERKDYKIVRSKGVEDPYPLKKDVLSFLDSIKIDLLSVSNGGFKARQEELLKESKD